MNRFSVIVAIACTALPAWAGGDPSDGHTHGPDEISPVVAEAPRATASSEDFELVAVPAAGELRLYLDRYDSNAPVTGARVEVESGAFRAIAHEAEPGVYTVPGDAFAAPGRHPFSVTVETDSSADLLAATLDLGAASPAAPAVLSSWMAWAGGGVIAGVAGVVLWRQRRPVA